MGDAATVSDTATFEGDLTFSQGIPHVVVGGQFVVRDGVTVPDVYAGRPVFGKYRR